MSLKIEAGSTTLAAETVANLEADARSAFALLEALRERARIPDSDIVLIIADDLAASVRENMRVQREEGPFSPERVGGMVAAKNLPQSEDNSSVVIVFDATYWRVEADNQGSARVRQIFLLTHELSHVMLDRARHSSRALDGVVFPSFTGHEVARSLVRILADEYRADTLADLYLRQLASAEIDGEMRRVGVWEVFGADYVAAASASIAQAHPLWPDVVQNYREAKVDLSTMWGELVSNMEQTLTSLVHAQAAADGADGSLLVNEDPVRSMPSARLYLQPITSLFELLRQQPVLPNLDETKALDARLVEVGEGALIDVWRALGLTMEERPNRQWSLWVGEPVR